jgi:hypothetical protein
MRFVALYGLLSPSFEHFIRVGEADEFQDSDDFSIAMILKLDFFPQQFNDIPSVPQYRRVGRRMDLNFDIKRTTPQVLNTSNCITNQ